MKDQIDLFLVAAANEAARRNIERTLIQGVSADQYGRYSNYIGDDPSPIWGLTEGKANQYADKIEEGDLLLFYTGTNQQTGQKEYSYLATVQGSEWNDELAEVIWIDEDGDPGLEWPFVLFLSDIKDISVSSERLHNDIGYTTEHLQDFRRVTEERLQPQITETTRRGYLRDLTTEYEGITPTGDLSNQQTITESEEAAATQLSVGGDTVNREVREPNASVDNEPPERVRTEVTRTVRDTAMTNQLKREHGFKCQICGAQRQGKALKKYAEGHHLHPLGDDPPGLDIAENVLILCPNHHSDFDYGLVRIDPETYEIEHAYESFEGEHLRTVPGHEIGEEHCRYNNEHIAQF